ncbi:hypothetical protein M409DRAFT_22771 [Zasmidium cellare ATCC 36951]|uniref:Wax synthase domain-containing protein n=1 Tax=Zasmidium cellare ATCC 36951 TaxID=1080233 RepID=A0A6A6CHV0_ZASCE|nr:uncharacterized protein M409DRAFT_22771 [Zasmidium cellare ATCC 36951]KAF2166715.1 hypothetical protein M409DRAFT_22771 [Zasmidium cellare ATCC 36951]
MVTYLVQSLERLFASLVPYGNRPLQPAWHFPVHLAICILTIALPVGKQARLLVVLPAVLYSTFSRIAYTTGAVKDDYFNAMQFLVLTLNFVNHLVLRPYLTGKEARYMSSGSSRARNNLKEKVEEQRTTDSRLQDSRLQGKALSECTTFAQRLGWTVRLLTTFRGIGWNWQIKKIPENPDLDLSNGQAAVRHFRRLISVLVLHAVYLYIMTFTGTLQTRMRSRDDSPAWQRLLLHTLFTWSVQLWMIDSSKIIYHGLAATTLALKMQSPSDWPPYWGPFSDCWSVRTVWGDSYHQLFRHTFDNYSNLLVSLLDLSRGSFASRYTKLYTSFFVSVVIHWWFSFCAAPDEQGSFWFFMSQAVIISVEDAGRWAWRAVTGRNENDELTTFERVFGYVWTFCWFTYSWQIEIHFQMGTVEPMPFEPDLRGMASRHALLWM